MVQDHATFTISKIAPHVAFIYIYIFSITGCQFKIIFYALKLAPPTQFESRMLLSSNLEKKLSVISMATKEIIISNSLSKGSILRSFLIKNLTYTTGLDLITQLLTDRCIQLNIVFYADLINRSLTEKALCSIAGKILALFVGQMLKTYLKVDEVLSTVHGMK